MQVVLPVEESALTDVAVYLLIIFLLSLSLLSIFTKKGNIVNSAGVVVCESIILDL